MSFWDTVTDFLTGGAAYAASNSSSRRMEDRAKRDMKAQMDEYRKARELTEKQINMARDEKAANKRRIEEKQIRGLRNNYRAPGGFLNSQKSGLGNEALLPSKLGTV